MYWVEKAIGSAHGKIERHQFHNLEQFSSGTIEKLKTVGVIREIIAPPLEIMTALKTHAILLHKAGCHTLLDVLRLGVSGLQELLPEIDAEHVLSQVETVLRPDTPASGG